MSMEANVRLALAADAILQRTRGDFSRALAQFTEVIETDAQLRAAMIEGYLRGRADRDDSLRGGGRSSNATLEKIASSSQSSTGVGQGLRVSPETKLRLPTPVTLRSGERHGDCDLQRIFAPPAPKPNPPRALAARLVTRTETAQTVLDTFKVRDGRAVGDLQWFELRTIARTDETEARVLRYVADHIANAPDHAKVRDLVKPAVLDAAIKHAEAVNAAA